MGSFWKWPSEILNMVQVLCRLALLTRTVPGRTRTYASQSGDGPCQQRPHVAGWGLWRFTSVKRHIYYVELISNYVQIISTETEIPPSCFAQRLTSIKSTHLLIITDNACAKDSKTVRSDFARMIFCAGIFVLETSPYWSSPRGHLEFSSGLNSTTNSPAEAFFFFFFLTKWVANARRQIVSEHV